MPSKKKSKPEQELEPDKKQIETFNFFPKEGEIEEQKAKAEYDELQRWRRELETKTMQALENQLTGYRVFQKYANYLLEKKVSDQIVGESFGNIAATIRQQYFDASHFLGELNEAGVNYFRSKVIVEFNIHNYEEIEDDRLDSIIDELENRIIKVDDYDIEQLKTNEGRFKFKALKDLQCELKKESEKRIAKNQQKDAFAVILAIINATNQTEEKRDKSIQGKQRQVFLALRVWLSNSRTKNADKSEFMSFLSGFSAGEFDKAFSQYRDWGKLTDELKVVRLYFSKLRYKSIVEIIDEEINSLDTQDKTTRTPKTTLKINGKTSQR